MFFGKACSFSLPLLDPLTLYDFGVRPAYFLNVVKKYCNELNPSSKALGEWSVSLVVRFRIFYFNAIDVFFGSNPGIHSKP